MRALRDAAAIGFDELAARAHYPSDLLKEAENGPRLPTLPILAAYVRACDGSVPEWEERWRRLGGETRADPNLPVRPAGASPAAVAGARAGIGVSPPEAYDPDRIRAALRGDQSGPADGTGRADGPGISELGTPGLGITGLADGSQGTLGTPNGLEASGISGPANGLGTSVADGPGVYGAGDGPGATAGPEASRGWDTGPGQDGGGAHRAEGWAGEAVDRVRALRDDQFSASWLQDREPSLQAGDGTFSWLEPNRQAPAPPPPIPQASWTRGGALTAPEPAGGGRTWSGGDLTQGAGTTSIAQPRVAAESVGPAPATVVSQPSRRQNQVFTWRLLAVLVLAALLGSVLMMLVR